MRFSEIKGQSSAIDFLKGSVKNDRVAHAYIFFGPRGVGKFSAAVNFAKLMNCKAPDGIEPCEKCPSCQKITSSNHPDIFILKPEKEGASIKIERVRELIKDIGLKPYEGRKKVYIVDSAESMTHESANALLKTLEEPPSDSVIILIAEDPDRMFETLVSRSQLVRFYPLNTGEIKDILTGQYGIEGMKAHVLSRFCAGSLGAALRYKDDEFFEKRNRLLDSMKKGTFFDSDLEDTSKEELKVYLDIMLTWYRDMIMVRSGADISELINIDKKDDIFSEAKASSLEYLGNAIEKIVSTSFSLTALNANQKLVTSALGLKIQK